MSSSHLIPLPFLYGCTLSSANISPALGPALLASRPFLSYFTESPPHTHIPLLGKLLAIAEGLVCFQGNKLKIVKLNKNGNMRRESSESGRERKRAEERAGGSGRGVPEHTEMAGLCRNMKLGKEMEAQPLGGRGLG